LNILRFEIAGFWEKLRFEIAMFINKVIFMDTMKEILEKLNPWWNEEFNFKSIERKKYLDILKEQIDKKDINILTGIRRVGKTTLMYQLINFLLERKVNPKNILFLSLDVIYFKDYFIQDIISEYMKLNRISNKEKVYLFLDEITYKDNFNQELKNLYDFGNYAVFASSSSAKVLKDKKAFLTGRARYYEIHPLDFEEFCVFKGHSFKSNLPVLKSLFEEYMEMGGMPEFVLTKNPSYLSELLELIVSKDIVMEHDLKNKQLIFDLFRLLCERVGKQISYNKLSKILDVDNETVSKYVSYFLDTYLFDLVEIKGKLNQRILGKKKLYCIDVGLRNVVTGFKDLGSVYENLVYHVIKGEKPNFIYVDGMEIDFCFKDVLIEAKYGVVLEGKQKEFFDSLKFKKKIVANGVDFFLEKKC
jgi:uncharacterized protein